MATILAVDDDDLVQRLVTRAATSIGHECLGAASVAEARTVLAEHDVDLVVCDVRLPDESGLVLAREITEQLPDTGLFMLSGVDDPEVAAEALELGASAYVVKPFLVNEIVINVTNALRLRDLERRRRRYDAALAATAIARPASIGGALAEISARTEQQGVIDDELVRRVGQAFALADDPNGAHMERTRLVAEILGRSMGCDERHVADLGVAALLHDVGKIGVPDDVLLKPGRLDGREAELMRRHAELGYRLLAASAAPVLQLAATVAFTHHERWDGQGYPSELAGESIPLEARITAVADVFQALTADRADRPAYPVGDAVELVLTGAGSQFDPAVVAAFEASVDDVLAHGGPGTREVERTTVLIVDDHRMFGESVARLVGREPDLLPVGLAATAAEGVAMAMELRPGVVLVDWELPDDDGINVARKIRAELPATHVVLLTGRADDGRLMAALRAGCAGFVAKVEASSTIVSAIRTAAGGEAAVPTGKLLSLLSRVAERDATRGQGSDLSAREREVLSLLARGLDVDAVADRLVLSIHTVRNHLRNAMAKLGAHSRLDAVTTAARLGLIDLI